MIGLFVFSAIPLLLTGRDPLIEPTLPQRLSEGLIKGTLLAAYVVGVTRLPRYRRIFSYHGAEHMAIACAEAGQRADRRPTWRASIRRTRAAVPASWSSWPRSTRCCWRRLPRLGPMEDLALRVAFVPVTAAIAYELLRWGARRRGLGFALNRFGLLTQRLTTAYPDAGQIEVAIAAVEACRTGSVRTEPTTEAAPLPAC